MFLRVYDENSKKYFKSICYAKIDEGSFEKAVVVNPLTNCFVLVSYFNETKPDYHHPQYEHINYENERWQHANLDTLNRLNIYLKNNNLYNRNITYIGGLADVCNDYEFLSILFKNKCVPLTETKITVKTNSDVSDWNYIRTQNDADDFWELFAGFHDAQIKSMAYEEDYNLKKLNVIFDNSSWFGIVEFCFEGLMELHLTPPSENYSSEMFYGLLKVEDERILWAADIDKLDEGDTIENFEYEYDYIKALNLKWRKL